MTPEIDEHLSEWTWQRVVTTKYQWHAIVDRTTFHLASCH
uniref:Uncharacterized protein n=1 Tax=Peronospora matthiolae TaxID=2874970 RepID=A0AAV1UWS4_9STRA